MGVNEQENILK